MLSVKGLAVLGAIPRRTRGHEFGEVGKGVVRSGSRLGVVLHREQRELAMAHALDGSVVQVEVRDLERRARPAPRPRLQLPRIHGFAW